MKILNFTLLVLSVLVFSCKEEESTSQVLTGSWVELNGDILTFNSDNTFTFDRGKEVINGQEMPKNGSGIYHYKVAENRIELRNTLSSNSAYQSYLLIVEENKLEMTSFYDLSMSRILVFERSE